MFLLVGALRWKCVVQLALSRLITTVRCCMDSLLYFSMCFIRDLLLELRCAAFWVQVYRCTGVLVVHCQHRGAWLMITVRCCTARTVDVSFTLSMTLEAH
jgi:hypothetical protein